MKMMLRAESLELRDRNAATAAAGSALNAQPSTFNFPAP